MHGLIGFGSSQLASLSEGDSGAESHRPFASTANPGHCSHGGFAEVRVGRGSCCALAAERLRFEGHRARGRVRALRGSSILHPCRSRFGGSGCKSFSFGGAESSDCSKMWYLRRHFLGDGPNLLERPSHARLGTDRTTLLALVGIQALRARWWLDRPRGRRSARRVACVHGVAGAPDGVATPKESPRQGGRLQGVAATTGLPERPWGHGVAGAPMGSPERPRCRRSAHQVAGALGAPEPELSQARRL